VAMFGADRVLIGLDVLDGNPRVPRTSRLRYLCNLETLNSHHHPGSDAVDPSVLSALSSW
jgi:hypothetical protein